MKALVKAKPEKGLWLQEVDTPHVGPNDVLIKVKKASICGTDIHIYDWDEWAQTYIPVPLVIGHEFTGEIVEIGKEVDKSFVKIGDRVAGENHVACGHCRNCRSSFLHLCRGNISVGVTRDGCFADYVSIPATNAYPVKDTISDDVATLLNQFGNSVHAALSFNLVGEDVLITGAGPVGIMAVAVARHVGARHVVITDVNEYRLKLAEKMGASMAINVNKTSLDDAMSQLNMKEGFDVGLEMSGHPAAFNQMVNAMNHAGKITLLGFLPNETQVDWSEIIMKGLLIKGIYGREMYDTWYKMTSMLQSGLDITPVITHEYPISEYQTAFDTMRSGQSGKIILNWT